jgi:hypothetical protein
MRLLPVLALCLGLAGCDRRLEPWVEADAEPPRAEKPVRIPGLAQPVPEPLPTAAAAASAGAGETLRGTVRLAAGATVPDGSVLFVIARSPGGGPPLAVKRLPPGPFPLAFEIGAADAMIAGRPFAGPISLSARIDSDGDPLTRGESDLAAAHAEALEPGASAVDLVLAPPRP